MKSTQRASVQQSGFVAKIGLVENAGHRVGSIYERKPNPWFGFVKYKSPVLRQTADEPFVRLECAAVTFGKVFSINDDPREGECQICRVVGTSVAQRHPDAAVIVPRRTSAVESAIAQTDPTPRELHLKCIAGHARIAWQKASGDNRRSRGESARSEGTALASARCCCNRGRSKGACEG
jgi:hypothetical protein